MNRRHGNWVNGLPGVVPPAKATAFEMRASELGLTVSAYVESRELRQWCKENRNKSYVPEWLLQAWGMSVNADLL